MEMVREVERPLPVWHSALMEEVCVGVIFSAAVELFSSFFPVVLFNVYAVLGAPSLTGLSWSRIPLGAI